MVKVSTISEEVQEAAVENERRILKKLPKSAYVANLLDDHEDSVAKKAYLVLERAGDLTLEAFVKQSPQGLARDQIKSIARQMTKAVAFLHEN